MTTFCGKRVSEMMPDEYIVMVGYLNDLFPSDENGLDMSAAPAEIQKPMTVCRDCEHHINTRACYECGKDEGAAGAAYLDKQYCSARELTESRHYVTGIPIWYDERWAIPRESSMPWLLCKDENDGNCSLFEPAAEAEAEAA